MFKHRMASGVVFTVMERPILGLLAHRESEMIVSPAQPPSERLETFIHEWLHAEFPGWSEDKVTAQGFRIAYGLWHCGCRKDRRLGAKRFELLAFLLAYLGDSRFGGRRKAPALARSLAGLLWKAGYRLPKKTK